MEQVCYFILRRYFSYYFFIFFLTWLRRGLQVDWQAFSFVRVFFS